MNTAPQSPEQQLLDIDHTMFVTLGIFVLCLFILTHFLWKPYLRLRELRVARVDGYRDEAARLDAEAGARLAHCEQQLAEARQAASAERARTRNEAQALEQKVLSEAQVKAQKDLAAARAKVDAALTGERAKLAERARALGAEAAMRILGRKLTP